MKKIIVTLKQHTPMIHFQHYQENATLRASEVKPKLDRYILEKLGENYNENKYEKGCEIAKKNGWIIGENALNYKLRITPLSKVDVFDINPLNEEEKRIQFPAYFANMNANFGDEMKFKRFSFCEKIELKFLFASTENIKPLFDEWMSKDNLISFFFKTNFGMRSSKGFGSFTVENIYKDGKKITDDPILWNHESFSKNEEGKYFIKYCPKEDILQDNIIFTKIFNIIDFYWRCLKSGINDTKREIIDKQTIQRKDQDKYIKSYLYKYLNKKKKYTWEKRKIKLDLDLCGKMIPPDKKNQSEQHDNINKNTFFARAFLGCPNNFIYNVHTGEIIVSKNKSNKDNKSETVGNNNSNDNQDTTSDKMYEVVKKYIIKINNRNIQRIPSPIMFKPVIIETKDKDKKKEGKKKYVVIYLVFNERIISSINDLKDKNIKYNFEKYDAKKNKDKKIIIKKCTVDLFTADKYMIDYKDLIEQYHKECNSKNSSWKKLINIETIELSDI